MTALTRIQREVLDKIIELVGDACPPSLTFLRSELGRDVRTTVTELVSLGYVRQPYTRGPYIPLKDAEGRELRVSVVPKTEAPCREPVGGMCAA